MIILYHQNNKVVEVDSNGKSIHFSETNIVKTLFNLSFIYSKELLIWCHVDLKSNLNLKKIAAIFHHQKIMASYDIYQNSFLPEAIGYVEDSLFVNINKEVSYATWLTSSCVGGVHSSILMLLKDKISTSDNFDYFLHSITKLVMPLGLLSYSEPQLLTGTFNNIKSKQQNLYLLFRFTRQHYRLRWIFLLVLNLFLYERRIAILPFISAFFYSRRKLNSEVLDTIEVQSKNETIVLGTVDVIIPTIGRKKYLYDVLKDLKQQTHLPKKVIIVEQNPDLESFSDLNYINDEIWPFEIKHIFIHQMGACNARNLALQDVNSEFIFMADDDIRFEHYFLEKAMKQINQYGVKAVTFNCFQKDEKPIFKNVFQWTTFGSGCSMVRTEDLKNLEFDIKFEFGFGEDADFGMQLRNRGVDVIYFPSPAIFHLKAPIGGFRTKPVLSWQNDIIQPKPSPTVMLFKKKYISKHQLNGYKTTLFYKFYKFQSIKNPIQYFINFKKQWSKSEYWANELNQPK